MENILIQGAAAAFIGLAIGYSFKKFVKVGLFLLGVSLMLLFAALRSHTILLRFLIREF